VCACLRGCIWECVFVCVCLSVFVCVRKQASISHAQFRSVLSSRCTALNSQYHRRSVAAYCSLYAGSSVCAVVLVGQQQERIDRVDWMGLTDIDTSDCCKFVPKPVQNKSDHKCWGGMGARIRNGLCVQESGKN
jgi:drug/metabolite transporter superfamily protein YnfA